MSQFHPRNDALLSIHHPFIQCSRRSSIDIFFQKVYSASSFPISPSFVNWLFSSTIDICWYLPSHLNSEQARLHPTASHSQPHFRQCARHWNPLYQGLSIRAYAWSLRSSWYLDLHERADKAHFTRKFKCNVSCRGTHPVEEFGYVVGETDYYRTWHAHQTAQPRSQRIAVGGIWHVAVHCRHTVCVQGCGTVFV